jgi:histidine kinase/DNA gyrase B/HSP90-like ATPase/phospho-acceptor domain-containing protein
VKDVTAIVQYINLALYTGVAVVAVQQWRRHRERASLWAALTFVALAAVVDIGQALPDQPETTWQKVGTRLLVAVLVVFPYLLYRFATSFRPTSRQISLLVGTLTVIMVVWTFVQPVFPQEGEAWPRSFVAYVAGFMVHWTFLTIVVTWQLWTAGRGEASVARRRMRLLAIAASTITLALFVAISSPDPSSGLTLVSQLLSTGSATLFLLGLSPPPLLRMAWRRTEQQRLQRAVADLMSASTDREVVDHVLPGMSEIVGARAVQLRDDSGTVLATHGSPSEADGRQARVEVPGGEVIVWTSPYAPFFGSDELSLLKTLTALTIVALDRVRLFAHEREARVALERADELKTNFVALAAHELRTPVATVHGLVETIHMRRTELDERQVAELEGVLRGQTGRLKSLVEQLLDLSRLDAEAVHIEPQRFRVRRRVEEIVAASVPERVREVEIVVEPGLEAEIDPDAFDRIVSNLVVNALRYGEAPVTVEAIQSDRHFRLTVEDRGLGVAPEFVPDLFERFSRSQRARERAIGTGLGLAIARSYAQAHHGDLIYEPAQPSGARFQLVLPLR